MRTYDSRGIWKETPYTPKGSMTILSTGECTVTIPETLTVEERDVSDNKFISEAPKKNLSELLKEYEASNPGASVAIPLETLPGFKPSTQVNEAVNHPKHYNSSKFEPIDVIEDWELDFCLGNTVKYISRAGKKDPNKEIEDLEKARWYLDRRIQTLKTNG